MSVSNSDAKAIPHRHPSSSDETNRCGHTHTVKVVTKARAAVTVLIIAN